MSGTSLPTSGQRRIPLRFDARGANDWVLITKDSSDDEEFVRVAHAEQVRQALKLQDAVAAVFKILDEMLAFAGTWALEHRERLSHVYATLRDGELLFVFVQAGRRYDFDLEDPLTELDLKMAKRFKSVPFSVMQMPAPSDDELFSFLDRNLLFEFTGLQDE